MTAQKNLIRWDSGTNALLGIWLVIAPFTLMYGVATATWNDVILGLVIATLAAIRLFGAFGASALSWTNVFLGAWLVAAPFALGYVALTAALWNDILVGLTVMVLAWRSAAAKPKPPTPTT